jgi:hypothetical protein
VNFSVEDRWCKVWFGREEHEFMSAYMAGIGPVLEIAFSYHFGSGTEYSIFMYISTHHPPPHSQHYLKFFKFPRMLQIRLDQFFEKFSKLFMLHQRHHR